MDEGEVWFSEPSHPAPFVMFVGPDRYLDVEERLLCRHFETELGLSVVVEREEFDEDMILMRTILQRPHSCIPRWSYRVFPRYYKVLSLASPVSASQQSLRTLESVSTFSRLSSGVKKSVLPTIPESPDVKVHYLSSDSESEGDDLSDPKVASCELRLQSTLSNRKISQSDGVGNSDSRYPNLTRATHDDGGGNLEAADVSVEFAHPSDETASEETIRASVWTALTHRGHIADSDSNPIAFETPSGVSISESGLRSTPQSM